MTEIIHYRYRYPLKLFFRIQSKHGPEPAEYVCRFDGKIFTSMAARRHVISAHPGRLEDMINAGVVKKKFRRREEVVRSGNAKRNLMIHRDVILKQIGREDLLEETA